MDLIFAGFARCLQRGDAPESGEAQEWVEKLRRHITQHYYPCTQEILADLGQMYVADERFRKNIDNHAEGTAAFASQAIQYYSRN